MNTNKALHVSLSLNSSSSVADFKISEYNILLDDLKESVKNDTKLNMSTIKGLEILQKQIQWQASRSASTMYGDSKDRITLTNGDQSFSIEWSK